MSGDRHWMRILSLAILFLAAAGMFPNPCAAEYLLDTARQYSFGDGYEVLGISTADVNGDGVADLVGLVSWYQGTEDAVVVRLGTGGLIMFLDFLKAECFGIISVFCHQSVMGSGLDDPSRFE